MALHFFDALLTLAHLLVVGFNLFGWIWPRTRRLHLYCVAATAFSWVVLGIWYGLGYCPITDWQWQVKTQLGEKGLPYSFVKYWADRLTGLDVGTGLVDTVTALSFAGAAGLAVYFNFINPKGKSLKPNP